MQKLKKNFFYIKELSSSSEDFESEYGSFSNPRIAGFQTKKQLRRGSTHITTEPVTLNKYAMAYLNQQHSDPGYNRSALAQKDQQHSDPGRFMQNKKDQQHSDPGRFIQNKKDQQHSDPDRFNQIKKGQQYSDPDQDPQLQKVMFGQQHSDPDQQRMTWLKLCCCFTEESTKVAPLSEFSINTRLKRQPSFKYPK